MSNEACEYVVSIDDEANSTSFEMYPNPAVDYVVISTTQELSRVTVYNAVGQLVMDEKVTGNRYELQTSAYTIGTYMVRVETDHGVKTEVLSVQR